LTVGRKTIHHTCSIILATLLHSSFPSTVLATSLAVSASTIQFDFGLVHEIGNPRPCLLLLSVSSSLERYPSATIFLLVVELDEADLALVSEGLSLAARILAFQQGKERVEARLVNRRIIVEAETWRLDECCHRLSNCGLCL
jgi:hypothetical protein